MLISRLSLRSGAIVCLILQSFVMETNVATASDPVAADSGFSSYFDAERLQAAVESSKASDITDVALQLADGERVLLRTHQSGVTSRALLEVALKLAIESKDVATLDRLTKAASAAKLNDLEARIAAGKQLAGASRGENAGLKVSLDSLDAQTLQIYESLIDRIVLTAATRDRETLTELRDTAADYADLTDELKKAVAAKAAQALEELPETSDEASDALAVLSGITRAEPQLTGVIAIQTNVTSVGTGQLAAAKLDSGLTPVSKCNLRNTQKSDCVFRCVGTGKTYTLKPGQSMNFTIYGKVTSKPIPKAAIGVLAISTTALDPMKVDLPYIEFYTYGAGPHNVVVPNGNLDITMSKGFYRLKKRG